uniref:(northern house mosquito) hypothetical protein n=1 Tax=Culex pipiens TaxID=7175 RepID=A0A8D8CB91_CULPI
MQNYPLQSSLPLLARPVTNPTITVLFDNITIAVLVQLFVALVHIFSDHFFAGTAKRCHCIVSSVASYLRRRLSRWLAVSNGPVDRPSASVLFPVVIVVVVLVLEALARFGHRIVHQDVGEVVVFVHVFIELVQQLLVLAAGPKLTHRQQPQQGQRYQLTAGHVTQPQPVRPDDEGDP